MIVLWVHGSVCMSFIISAVDLCVSSPSHEADQRPPSREKLTWCSRAGIPTWSGSWVCSRAMWATHRSSRGWWWSSCPRVRWPICCRRWPGHHRGLWPSAWRTRSAWAWTSSIICLSCIWTSSPATCCWTTASEPKWELRFGVCLFLDSVFVL